MIKAEKKCGNNMNKLDDEFFYGICNKCEDWVMVFQHGKKSLCKFCLLGEKEEEIRDRRLQNRYAYFGVCDDKECCGGLKECSCKQPGCYGRLPMTWFDKNGICIKKWKTPTQECIENVISLFEKYWEEISKNPVQIFYEKNKVISMYEKEYHFLSLLSAIENKIMGDDWLREKWKRENKGHIENEKWVKKGF